MFSPDFYPTPPEVIAEMLKDTEIAGKVILEPSAGSGNIIDYCLTEHAKSVLFCEKHPELQKIASTKGKFLCSDFLTLESEKVSHIDLIIMNPPFSNAQDHIMKAWELAPEGCKIIALCNLQTIKNPHTSYRQKLVTLIDEYGSFRDLGNCFGQAERKTDVSVACVILQKPAPDYKTEFSGFFMDEEPEEQGTAGLMSYNVIRDLVNRYVEAIKIFDQ